MPVIFANIIILFELLISFIKKKISPTPTGLIFFNTFFEQYSLCATEDVTSLPTV